MSVPVYARELLRHAQRALRVVPVADLEAAFAAVDRFLATPRGDTFVAASRAFRQARVGHAGRHLAVSHAGRAFARGLEALRAAPGLDPAHVEALAQLPLDTRTGQRLAALAQLLEIHVELSGCAAAASRELRRKLEAAQRSRPAQTATWREPSPPRRAS